MAAISRTDATDLMPEEVSREIIQSLPQSSVVLSRARRVTMSRKQQRMPVLSVLPQAYWVDGDTGLKQTSRQAWANKYLTAEELAVIIPIPDAVVEDADYDIWGEIRPRAEEAIGLAVDAAVFFGTDAPTSFPVALVPAAIAAGNKMVRGSVSGQDLANDISDVMNFVEEDGFDVTAFAARIGLKNSLRKLRNENRDPIYQPSLVAATPSMLFGQAIQFVRNEAWDADEADLLAGDFTQLVIGIRQDIQTKILTEATLHDNQGNVMFNLAQQDMRAMRLTFRIAWQVANPVTRSNTNNSSRYPFAVLQPAA